VRKASGSAEPWRIADDELAAIQEALAEMDAPRGGDEEEDG